MGGRNMYLWVADIYRQAADGGVIQFKNHTSGGVAYWEYLTHDLGGPTTLSNPEDWRIVPKLKQIDRTPLVNSGLDCEFGGLHGLQREIGKLKEVSHFNHPYTYRRDNGKSYAECEPRMTPHIHYWTGKKSQSPVPEGYRFKVHYRCSTCEDHPKGTLDWGFRGSDHDIIGIEFMGIQEDYTLGAIHD